MIDNAHSTAAKKVIWLLFVVFFVIINSSCRAENDPFIRDIKNVAIQNTKDFSHIANHYIPPGTHRAAAIAFLEARGFKIHDTKPENWDHKLNAGETRYLAQYQWRPNLFVLVKSNIILIVNEKEVISVAGKNHLTGF